MGRGRRVTTIRRRAFLAAVLSGLLVVSSISSAEPVRSDEAAEELDYRRLEPGQRQRHYRALFEFAGAYPSRIDGGLWEGFFDHSAEAVDLTLDGAQDPRHGSGPDHPVRSFDGYGWRPYQRRYRPGDFLGFLPIDSMTVAVAPEFAPDSVEAQQRPPRPHEVTSEPLYLYRATLPAGIWSSNYRDDRPHPPFVVPHDLVLGTFDSIQLIERDVDLFCRYNRWRPISEAAMPDEDEAEADRVRMIDEWCSSVSNYVLVQEVGHVFPEYVPGTVPLYWAIETAVQQSDTGKGWDEREYLQSPLVDARIGRVEDFEQRRNRGVWVLDDDYPGSREELVVSTLFNTGFWDPSPDVVNDANAVHGFNVNHPPFDPDAEHLLGYVFPTLPEIVDTPEQVCGSRTEPCDIESPTAPTIRYQAWFTNHSSQSQDSSFAIEYQVGERTSVSESRTASETRDLTVGVTVGVTTGVEVEAGIASYQTQVSVESSFQAGVSNTVELGRETTVETSEQTTETFSVPVRVAPWSEATATVDVYYDVLARDTYLATIQPVLRHWDDDRALSMDVLDTARPADSPGLTVEDLTIEVEFDVEASRSNRVVTAITETPLDRPDPEPEPEPGPPELVRGYRVVEESGVVHGFGDAHRLGDALVPPGVRAVDIDDTDDGTGYWVVDDHGTVYAFGTATHFGHLPRLGADEAVTAISATPTEGGYWLFTSLGNAHAYGDARLFPAGGVPGNPVDMGAIPLNGPVLDAVPTPSGVGYYLVGADGGVFAFGDAAFHGSMGGMSLNEPVRSLVPDPDGTGYWLVAADGGVFAFEAEFVGSVPGILATGESLNAPVTGMVPWGDGYLMVAADGGVFTFSDEPFLGSLGAEPPPLPITSIAGFGPAA